MSTATIEAARIVSGQHGTPADQANRVVDAFVALLDEVDSETIAAEYGIGIHSKRIDFNEHALSIDHAVCGLDR